jgi:L-lactate dehydrogenase complex protein LldF
MLRAWRERDFAEGKRSRAEGLALKAWAFAAKRPGLYHALAAVGGPLLTRLAGGRGRFTRLAICQALDKTCATCLPPKGRTFQQLYAKMQKDRK